MSAWDYTVEVWSSLEGSYVKSIHLGDIDVLKGGLQVDLPPLGSLEILIGTDTGSLDGTLIRDNSGTVDNYRVVLVPTDAQQHRIDNSKTAWTDDSGGFHMDRIPPGDAAFIWIAFRPAITRCLHGNRLTRMHGRIRNFYVSMKAGERRSTSGRKQERG